jgi:hypothetical protein
MECPHEENAEGDSLDLVLRYFNPLEDEGGQNIGLHVLGSTHIPAPPSLLSYRIWDHPLQGY